ncbi:type VI secretion protein, partial [Actinoplanes sp. NPDC024001]
MSPTPQPEPTWPKAPLPPPPEVRLLDLLGDAVAAVTARPWLALLPAVLVLAAVTADALLRRGRHQRLTRHAKQILITPPPQVDAAGAAVWWANLAELIAARRPGRFRTIPHVGFEYRWAGRQLTIGVWLPGTVPARPVAAAVRAAWPGATATIIDATAPLPLP